MAGSQQAELALFATIMPKVERIQDTVARQQAAQVRRAFHNKGTVVEIRLDVADDLPPHLRRAWLQPGATWHGFGRFSRSQSFHRADGTRDQRGFAIRLELDGGAQDLLFSNTPASFARDPVQFMTVATIFAESPLLVAPIRTILAVGLREGVRILRNLLSAPDRQLTFTSQRYWSRTPFQIGDMAARLFVRPHAAPRLVGRADDPDYLTIDLTQELAEEARAFDLCAQLFVDERRTPIEDASRVWEEADSPPVVIGTITIPRQELTSPAAAALAERVERLEAFSPIVTPGLRPLGRMNRARVLAYARSAEHRGAAPRRA